jgi:hypothetical protein
MPLRFLGDTLFPSVRVIDKVGNGVPGVPVAWTVADKLSSIDLADTKTDADGIAAPGRWITSPLGATFIVATPTPSKLENAPLSLYATTLPIGRFLPPKMPPAPR